MFEEVVHIRPKPGIELIVSRRVPSAAEQNCRALRTLIRISNDRGLEATDLAELACIFLLVVVAADILFTLCTKTHKHVSFARSRDFVSMFAA